ncbi:MAG: hypothetical protein IT513_01540 [Burkholderiales bacterium]|nr:hypothetical protein [Burkholderiales bacterium]
MSDINLGEQDESSEWVGADAIDHFIRQGDCIALRNTCDEIGPVAFGLVITADCDIVQRKTSGYVTYVPLISLEDFIYRFWIPEHIESKGHGQRCIEAARKLVHERAMELSPSAQPMSEVGLIRMAEVGMDTIFPNEDQNLKRAKRLAAYLSSLHSLRTLRDPLGRRSLEELRECLTNFLKNLELPSEARLLGRAADAIKEAVTGAGTLDIYPLSRLALESERPHMAMLRFVRSIPESSVTSSHADFRFGQKLACRIGRLRHDVKYECLQRFGRLFVRTGKSDTINDACKVRIQAAVAALGGEANG